VTRLRVPDEARGTRLDRFLALLPEVGSRAVAQRLLQGGGVLVDGRTRPKSHRLEGGEELELEPPAPAPSGLVPEAIDLAIPYEDEHLLVVDKPAGLVVHPAPGHARGTLVHGLLAYDVEGGEEPGRPGIVHRLDRDTSGLMVVAKTGGAHRALVEAIKNREVSRRYLALVWGVPGAASGVIEAAIGRDPRRRQRMAVVGRGGRPARTRWRVTERFGVCAALAVALDTGRTHQIRVHLSHLGHPVVGDPVYGGRARMRLRLPTAERNLVAALLGMLPRQALHASELEFAHPISGRKLHFEAPLPRDIAGALAWLRECHGHQRRTTCP
jgi:23S rRNA pseudouridine1911/1915/1917 synthase